VATGPLLPFAPHDATHTLAFVELHVSVLLCPAVIDVGFALTVAVGGTGAGTTVTVTCAVAVGVPMPTPWQTKM
jgi:hypothetical protein